MGAKRAVILRALAAGAAAAVSFVDSGPRRPEASLVTRVPSGTATPIAVASQTESPSEAAVRVVSAMPRLVRLAPGDAEAELRALSSSEDAKRLRDELRDDLARLAVGFPGGSTAYWVGPLATRERPAGSRRARVDVWYVQAVAPPRLAPYADWRIGRLELALEQGRWRLASFEDLPGPRPRALSGEGISREALFGELTGFVEVTRG